MRANLLFIVLAIIGSILLCDSAKAEGIADSVAVESHSAPPEIAFRTLEEDLAAAEVYWQAPLPPAVCLGSTVGYANLPPDRWGEATLPTPGWEGDCVMYVTPGLKPEDQCLVVVHEAGHWLGLPHNADPASPMYELGPWWTTVPQCEAD